VSGADLQVPDGATLRNRPEGWQYDEELKATIVKATMGESPHEFRVNW
jgi:hypothetical protein